MKGICLLIDRLHIGYVGAYGNSWIETPSLDRLAVESFLLDRYWIDSPRLDVLYRSLWQGRHALAPAVPAEQEASLASLVSAAGVPTALVSDDPAVLEHGLGQDFGRRLLLPGAHTAELADHWEESQLAGAFAELLQWLDTADQDSLVWCHLGGLGAVWDAPYELRARYAAEGDPDPPPSAAVPALVLDADYDPDLLLGITQSYAGQITLLDRCLGAIVEWLETSPRGRDALLLVASARGLPLGEHRLVGGEALSVHGEIAHVPAFLRLPGGEGAAARTQALAEPADLWATLLDWFGLAGSNDPRHGRSLLPVVRDEIAGVRDRLCIVGAGEERGIVTQAWFGRFADKAQLYLKPDDRWEVNDVADRCPQIVDALEAALREAEERLSGRNTAPWPALDDVLLPSDFGF
ncbi:MAG: sulfatase-like hydrolase/transferase [Pirellulales bacterium]|nr:sulfatase-like hydrolase/transferase [Pirellulales bacterium]